MKKLKVSLVSHPFKDDNLGCVALAISNITILDQVFREMGIDVEYVLATIDSLEQVDMKPYTSNKCEYRLYPRCRQTIRNPMRLLSTKVFEDCDISFNLCGGDGYTDIYGFGRLMAESQLAWISRMHKVPMVYAPQTIGPFNSKKGRTLAKATLNKVEKIFVRDGASYSCCKELGFNSKTIEVIDVAFALPFHKRICEVDDRKINVGINISGLLYNGGYNRNNNFGLSFDYKSFINILLEKLSRDSSYKVHLISHVNSYSNEIEDDYRVCEKLSKEYNCILAPRYESPVDVKGYIASMDLFSGARMHSTIGALSSGVPVIPVAYSRKFNGLYESLNYPWMIDAKSAELNQAVDYFFVCLDSISNMSMSVEESEKIFTERLEDYKCSLKKVIKEAIA